VALRSIAEVRGYDHVVVSPHPDDAALSCGGAIAAFGARAERVLVLTVCTASPPAGTRFNAMSESLHRAQGASAAELFRLRRTEDVRACGLLGADVVHGDLLDAPYRHPRAYDTRARLFGTLAPDDDAVARVSHLLQALGERLPGATLHAPLGVGGHVDHRATHAAAREADGFARRLFYEDFPYAAQVPGAVDARLASAGGTFAPVAFDVGATLARKLEAIRAYESQIAILFGTDAKMARMVEAHARACGDVATPIAERLWREVDQPGRS
jgi:LmbE family N-acetylglucosaminyl deacetylase